MKIFTFMALLLYACEGSKILVVFPFPAKSHGILGAAIVKHLLNDGHEVTYITPLPWNELTTNLHIVDVKDNFNVMSKNARSIKSLMDNEIEMSGMTMMFLSQRVSRNTIENKNVQNLLMDTKNNFDVVIAEWLFDDLYATLAAVYDCPMIWFSSVDTHWQIRQFVDGLVNPDYNPDIVTQARPPFNFWERVNELWSCLKLLVIEKTIMRYKGYSTYQKLVVPAIVARNRTVPYYSDTLYNISLILANAYPPLNEPMDLPQNIKNIGGYHIESPVPLPQDLQSIMDDAKNGVIYFSMGSNLKSKDMPDVLKSDLVNMFGELNQTVIWKFEEDLPNTPENLHIMQWAPQTSILAHPKCVLFITHGGLLSSTETIYFGVPVIGIPVFGDQFINTDKYEQKGFGKKVRLSYNTAADLKQAVIEVLSNSKYREKAKELSALFNDRVVPPGVELTHWVNHVVRTKGASHLRSPILLTPWYQKTYLDLITVALILIWMLQFLCKKMLGVKIGKKLRSKKDN